MSQRQIDEYEQAKHEQEKWEMSQKKNESHPSSGEGLLRRIRPDMVAALGRRGMNNGPPFIYFLLRDATGDV